MNLDDYKSAWQTGGAAPAPPLRAELEALAGRMASEDRRGRLILGACAVNTALALFFTLYILGVRSPHDWAQAMPLLAFQTISALALASLIRRRIARRNDAVAATEPVRASAQRSLAAVQREARELWLLAGVAALAVPVLAFAVSTLMEAGKMDARAATGFAALCAVVIGVNAVIKWRRYYKVIAPRRARLEQILQGVGENA